VSLANTIALGALLGLAVGIVVSVTTDAPFAPEAGIVLGGLVGWLAGRRRARTRP
jgi:xanthosine utilization system XapX-like protein